jgi:sugar diacid utilization regulator/GAF domain-containing protein
MQTTTFPDEHAPSGSGGARAAHAFAAARAITAATDVDDLLRVVARVVTETVPVARCSVYLRDEDGRGFAGRAGHPGGDLDAAVRGLRMGGPSDQLTRRIEAHDGPLVLRDLQRDPDAATGLLRDWNVTALLAVPMSTGGETHGYLICDHAGRPHPFDDGHVRTAGELAALAAAALVRLRADSVRAEEARRAAARARALADVTAADERLAAVLLQDGGIAGVLAAGGALLHRSLVAYDADAHRLADSSAAGDAPVRLHETVPGNAAVASLLEDAPTGGALRVPAMLSEGLRHRHLVAPVDVDGDRWGWIVVAERRTRLSAVDERLLRRIAAYVALELTVQRRTSLASLDARSTLARLLIRGTYDTEEVTRCATFLGVVLRAPRLVAYVGDPDATSNVDVVALVTALRAEGVEDVLATKGPEGVALMIDVPADGPALVAVADAKRAVARACVALGTPGIVAGLSTVRRDPREMPSAYREARETARCLTRVGGGRRHGVLAADDLGPARMFVAGADRTELDRFVADVLGGLLDDEETSADLLRTLQSLVDHGRNIRHSAAALGIHENTVRYRLNRVHRLTGLDVASDAHAQLSVQTALLVLRLQGHPALPAFAGDGPVEVDRRL